MLEIDGFITILVMTRSLAFRVVPRRVVRSHVHSKKIVSVIAGLKQEKEQNLLTNE